MKRAFIAFRALVWAALFIGLWTWLASWARGLDVAAGRYLPFAGVFPGLALAALGAVLVVACVATFVVRGEGTPAVFDAPRRFVASGPYRWVRNPMYIGAVSVIAGCGFAFRSPAVVALGLGAWILFHLFVVFVEEPGLERRFGESYRAYKGAIARWLPRPPRA